LVAAANFLVAATKNLFVVPNFVAVTKHFFPCGATKKIAEERWIFVLMLYRNEGPNEPLPSLVKTKLDAVKSSLNLSFCIVLIPHNDFESSRSKFESVKV